MRRIERLWHASPTTSDGGGPPEPASVPPRGIGSGPEPAGSTVAPGSIAPEQRKSLLERVRNRFVASGSPITPANVATALRAEGTLLGGTDMLELTRALSADLHGAGPLEELMTTDVTDILVNGPDQVWVDTGEGLRRVEHVRFDSADEVRRLAQRLAFRAGRRLDAASPYVDAWLPGERRCKTQ